MANEKALRANVQILAAYPEAFADPDHPTAAELNKLWGYTGADRFNKVFNISCAILDDYTLNMSDSETSDDITICDQGGVSTPTFFSYEASLDGLRDADLTGQGVFNEFFYLFIGKDRPYLLIKRIGKPADAPYLTDGSDVISIYGVNTDNPVDVVDDNSLVKIGARFKTTGDIAINYSVVS